MCSKPIYMVAPYTCHLHLPSVMLTFIFNEMCTGALSTFREACALLSMLLILSLSLFLTLEFIN